MTYRVVASTYGEDDLPGRSPSELVAAHAAAKARDVVARSGVPAGGAVLAADTAVVLGDDVLGKPVDREDAARMIRALAGRDHVVSTGVYLVTEDGEHDFVDHAVVTFRPLGESQLAWYLTRGEWQGRAGGYAIQGSGATLVESIIGDATTVVGLPIGRLVGLLESVGQAPW